MKLLTPAALATALVLLALPTQASAQAIGGGVYVDSRAEDLGLGANFVFHTGGIVDSSRAAVDFKYFLSDGTYMAGNLDGQYLWFKGPSALAYGLLGVNVAVVDPDIGEGTSDLGLNLGLGAELTLARGVAAYAEGKFIWSIAGGLRDRFIGGGGVRFYLGGGGGGNLNLSDM